MTEELSAAELESELPLALPQPLGPQAQVRRIRVIERLVRQGVQELYVTFGVGSVVPLQSGYGHRFRSAFST